MHCVPIPPQELESSLEFLDPYTAVHRYGLSYNYSPQHLFYYSPCGLVAVKDHFGTEDEDLSFQAGDIIGVWGRRLERGPEERDGWWLGTHVEESGRIPGKYVFDPSCVKPVMEESEDQFRTYPRYTLPSNYTTDF